MKLNDVKYDHLTIEDPQTKRVERISVRRWEARVGSDRLYIKNDYGTIGYIEVNTGKLRECSVRYQDLAYAVKSALEAK